MGMGLSDRIKTARKGTGLTQKQVADRTGIDDSTISKFESGDSEPRLGQLEKLASAYHLSLSYFFSNVPPETPIVLWRNEPTEAREVESRFLQLCRRYHQLEVWTDEVNRERLPDLDNIAGTFSYAQVENLARSTRNHLGLGDRPGERLATVLGEVYGLKIFYMNLGDGGSAACTVSGEFGMAILLNLESIRWRRNFDLAHELFHILTWKRFGHDEDGTVCHPHSEEDKFAGCFARNLLLPMDAIKAAINREAGTSGKITYNQLDGIAREFDVSLEAMFWRLHYLFGWNNTKTKEHIQKVQLAVRESRTDETRPAELPERYKALAIQALQNGEISIGRFAQFMNISRYQAQQYLTGEECGYAEIPTPVS